MVFEKELKRLGLKDKEASVYLACLELGPSAAQPISRKARVVRATTYVVLESLMKQGLVTKYRKGKKTLFSAEPPRQLVRLLEKQQQALNERQRYLDVMLPELQTLLAGEDRPSVRYFEGREGLYAMRQEIIREMRPGGTIYNFTPSDHLQAVFPEELDTFPKVREAKHIRSKTIFTTHSEELRRLLLSPQFTGYAERRFVPADRFPFASGLTVFGNKIALGSFSQNLMGVVIESETIAGMIRSIFELAWEGAAVFEKE